MIFGDKQRFAVEVELDENYGGEWLYGKICYWLNGTQYGYYDEGTTLRDVLSMMRWIIFDQGNRDGETLCGLSLNDAFCLLHDSLYDEKKVSDVLNLPESPARFEVGIKVDVLFTLQLYLINCGGNDKLLYKSNDEPDVKGLVLIKGEFDYIMKQLYEFLDRLHEKEITH